jgi:hypothetical protein
LRWGLFAGAGVWLGLSALAADQLFGHHHSKLAAQLFPWNRYIRTQPGYDAIINLGSTHDIIEALASDPYSKDLARYLNHRLKGHD